MTSGNWAVVPRPNPGAAVRLFCFPYAGGNVTAYRDWPDALYPAAEVCLVELPGRGGRLREPLFRRHGPLVEAMGEGLRDRMKGTFVFYGHSMGAILAFELARWLRKGALEMPSLIFAAGHVAPHVPDRHAQLHRLPDEELARELRALGGTPAEVFQHPELVEFLLPIIRADLEVNESYVCTEEPSLAVPVVALGGDQDRDVSAEDLDAWRLHTSAGCERQMVAGDHFFLHSSQEDVLRTVRSRLARLRRPGAGGVG